MSNASEKANESPSLFHRQHSIHGGPVTSATIRFPPPTHATIASHQHNDRATEYQRLKSQGRVVLSKGGWVESHPLCPSSNHDSAVYKSLAFGNSCNRDNVAFGAVSGMLFPSSAASLSYLNKAPTAGDPNGDLDVNDERCCKRVSSRISVVAYGSRRLSFLSGGGLWSNSDKHDISERDEFSLIPIIATSTYTNNDSNDYLEVCDWVHDVSLLNLNWKCYVDNQSKAEEATSNAFLLALGMVNNNCEIWGFRTTTTTTAMHDPGQKDQSALMATRLQCISCDVRCMTYSLSFHGWHEENHVQNNAEFPCLIIASGTVFGEIIVWGAVDESYNGHTLEKAIDRWLSGQISQDTTISRLCVPPSFRLEGHHGSVFSVKFGSSGEIASTSDDRTVRLWTLTPLLADNYDCKSTRKILQSQSTHSYKLIWTGWGHTARVWDVSFASLSTSTSSSLGNSTLLISSGEDGVARVWSPFVTEKELRRPFIGHRCESVWTVDVCEGIVVTGANDGSVKLFDLESSLANDGAKSYIVPLIERAPTNTSAHTTPGAQDHATTTMKKKRKKTKIKSQMIGMQFYSSSADRARKLLVAARDGSLFSLNLETEIWHTHSDWSREVTSYASGEIVEIDPSSGSCVAVHPSGGRVVLGTSEGLLVSSDIHISGDENLMSPRNSTFNMTRHGQVQSVRWHGNDLLVVFYSRGTIICYMFEDVPKLMHLMKLDTVGIIPLSSAHDNRMQDFYVGDSRGNIAYFSLSNLLAVPCVLGNNDMLNERNPCSIATKVHAREHVTAIVVSKSIGGVVSVGNDGYVTQCRLDDSGKLHKVFSIPVAGVTGLRNIWLNGNMKTDGNSFIVGGYYGNDFVIIDIEDGYQFFRLPTGGRQRRSDVNFDTALSNCYAMAVCTGHNSIEIHSVVSSKINGIQFWPSIGCTLHGETINKLCWVEHGGSSQVRYLLSGSNDCTVKLTKFDNDQIVSVKELPSHESCVRAVCASGHPGSNCSLLVACGGKLSLEFYLLAHMPCEFNDFIDVSFLCSYRTLVSSSIDPRMNAVKAIPLLQRKASHLVVAADSDGNMHLIIISEEAMPRRTTIGRIIQGNNRPILSLDVMECLGGKILAFVGDTAGDINVWDLSLYCNDCIGNEGGSAASIVFTVKAHSSGVNDLSVAALTQTESQEVILCSVGDDQHLSIHSFVLTKNKFDRAIELSQTRSIVSEYSSTSPSKAVKVVNENSMPFCFIFTSGPDQCVRLWCLELTTFIVTHISESSIETEGICIDCTRMVSSTKQVQVAIGGEGIELQSINYSTFEAAQQLYDTDYLLITAGAGFSADSGLSTYECAPMAIFGDLKAFETDCVKSMDLVRNISARVESGMQMANRDLEKNGRIGIKGLHNPNLANNRDSELQTMK
eukprot:scaffold93634_cov69-Cyclotella_meneghiniana.AAC.1